MSWALQRLNQVEDFLFEDLKIMGIAPTLLAGNQGGLCYDIGFSWYQDHLCVWTLWLFPSLEDSFLFGGSVSPKEATIEFVHFFADSCGE